MCIEASVGIGGTNNAADVKIVQILLNMAGANPALVADGLYGRNTDAAIDAFQAVPGPGATFRIVDPDGTTIKQLGQAIQKRLDAEFAAGRDDPYKPGADRPVSGAAGEGDGRSRHKPAASAGAFPGADRS